MSDYTKQAVLGTTDYHEVMRTIAMNSMTANAGFVAPKLEQAFAEYTGLRPYIYPIKAAIDTAIVWQWANGRGWICGSAALYEYSRSRDSEGTKWVYGDIDVFAHDETAFESLKAGLRDAWEVSDNDRSYKAEMVNIGNHNVGTVNVVCPPEGISWENPMNVWDSFDLNVAQCLIIAPELVAVAGDLALVHWNFADEDKRPFLTPKKGLKSAARFAERVLKYVSRGFRLTSDFWYTVYNRAENQGQQKAAEFESLIRFINNLTDTNNLKGIQRGGLSDIVDDLNNDGGSTDSYEQECDDIDDDSYWYS